MKPKRHDPAKVKASKASAEPKRNNPAKVKAGTAAVALILLFLSVFAFGFNGNSAGLYPMAGGETGSGSSNPLSMGLAGLGLAILAAVLIAALFFTQAKMHTKRQEIEEDFQKQWEQSNKARKPDEINYFNSKFE